MVKKVLIVDDSRHFQEKYRRLLEEMDMTAIVAGGVSEGIDKVLEEMPCCVITDYSLPDGTGNDLAKAVNHEYNGRVGGLTSGDPAKFDLDYIAISESKDVDDNGFQNMVSALIDSQDPAEGYRTSKDYKKVLDDAVMRYTAIDIVIQAYDLLHKARTSPDEIPEGLSIPIKTDEELYELFKTDDGLDLVQVYREASGQLRSIIDRLPAKMQASARKMLEDPDVQHFIDAVSERDYAAIGDSYKAFHDAFRELLEVK